MDQISFIGVSGKLAKYRVATLGIPGYSTAYEHVTPQTSLRNQNSAIFNHIVLDYV